jgi:2'-5' RNA ligase
MVGQAGDMEPELSAVVVPVPEAEPLVGRLRAELDVHASWGVPAHVSVLVPFVWPHEIDGSVVAALGEAIGSVPAFTTTFTRVAWFAEDVVWLAPDDAEPFVELTEAVQDVSGLVPYGGRHGTDVVPHLTVAHDAPLARLQAVAAELAAGLPLRAPIREAHLMVGARAPQTWQTVAALPLEL